MNTRLLSLLISGLVSCSLAAQVKTPKKSASTKSTATQAGKTKTEASKPSPVSQRSSFDLSVQQLPPLYFGASIAETTKTLADLQDAKKDQYETTAEYQARLEVLRSKPVFNEVKYGDLIALSVQEPILGRNYNADRGLMSLKFKVSTHTGTILAPSGYKPDRSRVILCLNQESTSKKATFSNAYGASVEGTDLNATGWNALMPSYTPSAIEFAMASEDARSMKDATFAAIFVGTLGSREVVESGTSSKATISNPTSFFMLDWSISFDPKELWVYVLETGKVLNKVKIEPTPLSRIGVSLAQESFPLLRFSILAPCSFKEDHKTLGSYPNTISLNTRVAQVPGVTVIVSETSRGVSATDVPWNIDVSMAQYEMATHPLDKTISDREVLGVPAKTMLSKVSNGGHTFIERAATFVLPDYAGRTKLIFVSVKVDAELDQAGSEVERIFNSLSKSR